MCVILCLTFQAKNVHGNVSSVDIKSHHARDGAQCIIIVGTVLIIKSMERTAQDVLAQHNLENTWLNGSSR